jgi:hypothetical protein
VQRFSATLQSFVHYHGLNVHAGGMIRAGDRAGLEPLWSWLELYGSRP